MNKANSPWGGNARMWVREVWSVKGSEYQAIYKAKCVKSFRSRQRAFEFVAACNKLFD